MLLKLVTFIIVLINSSTADSECLIDNHKSDNDIIREFLTVLQRMQSDTSENFRSMHSATSEILQSMHSATSENLRTIQSTTSVNIQSVISTINRQASSTDANLVNVIDAVESVSVETNAWRNDLSEIMTNMLNKTMNMILVNIDDNNKEFRVNDTLEQIETFTKTLESKLNSAMNGIREDLLTGMAKMLDQKMNVLIESYNSSLVQISNQMVQNNADVLSSQSAELSSIQETLSEINNVLAKVNNDTTHSVTNRVNIIDAVENNNQILQTQSNEISLLKETLADMNNVLAEMKTSTAFIKPKMEARNETTDTLNGDGVSIIDAVEKNNQIMQTQSNEISSVKETLADINSVLAELKNSTTCIKANMEVRNETTDMIDSDGDSDIDVSHKAVPSGFTSYNDHIVLLPTALGGTELYWHDSVSRCLQHGSVPFIPKSVDDFRYIQQVNTDIGGNGMWLPASDHVTEGVVKWSDGTDASQTLKLFDWHGGGAYPGDNDGGQDCVNIYTGYDNKLEFDSCANNYWSMICEII